MSPLQTSIPPPPETDARTRRANGTNEANEASDGGDLDDEELTMKQEVAGVVYEAPDTDAGDEVMHVRGEVAGGSEAFLRPAAGNRQGNFCATCKPSPSGRWVHRSFYSVCNESLLSCYHVRAIGGGRNYWVLSPTSTTTGRGALHH